MGRIIPQVDEIDLFKFYNLDKYSWRIDCGVPESIKFNNSILSEIANDFFNYAGIEYSKIMQTFGGYVCGKSSDNLMLLYTNKYSDEVYYYLTNHISQTYKLLN